MSDYFYSTLFLGEEDSDITIRALGKDWKLHKVFLKQSPYFSSMFSGSWKESSMDKIEIEIIDENITREALAFAFGSLYKENLYTSLKQEQVVGVLAASTLLLLEILTQHCCNFMVSTTNRSTVCSYYNASQSYCQDEVKNECMKWLTTNIMISKNVAFMGDISTDLMMNIVASPFLYLGQCENNVYFMLKLIDMIYEINIELLDKREKVLPQQRSEIETKWIFILNHPDCPGDNLIVNLPVNITSWYREKSQKTGTGQCYLQTKDGQQYAPVFAKIRWQDVIQSAKMLDVIKLDKIIPIEWLDPVFRQSWQTMLSFATSMDCGPGEVVNEDEFDRCSSRYGFGIKTEEKNAWRVGGGFNYMYGFDFSILQNKRVLSLKTRKIPNQPFSFNSFVIRHLCCRLTVTNVNQNGQEIVTNTTGIKRIGYGVHEDAELMTLDEYVEFPLLVRFNVLLSTKAINNCTEFG